jgi:hypothetical protein
MKDIKECLFAQRLSRQDFKKLAVALALENHGRKWECFVGTRSYGFTDDASAEEALDSVHKREVSNALYLNECDHTSGFEVGLPSPEAVADYPDLIAAYPLAVAKVLLDASRIETPVSVSAERAVVGSLLQALEGLLQHAKQASVPLETISGATLEPARELLASPGKRCRKEELLRGCLFQVIHGFDKGQIKGGVQLFEQARAVVESHGMLTFPTWIAGVCSELGVDEVEESSFIKSFELGLSPSEAVLQDRLSAGVLVH